MDLRVHWRQHPGGLRKLWQWSSLWVQQQLWQVLCSRQQGEVVACDDGGTNEGPLQLWGPCESPFCCETGWKRRSVSGVCPSHGSLGWGLHSLRSEVTLSPFLIPFSQTSNEDTQGQLLNPDERYYRYA